MKTNRPLRPTLALSAAKSTEVAQPYAFFTTSAEGYITDANTTFINLLGYSRRELLGKYFVKLMPVEHQAAAAAAHDAFVAGRAEEPAYMTFHAKNGQLVNLYAESLRDSDKEGNFSKLTLVENRYTIQHQQLDYNAANLRVA